MLVPVQLAPPTESANVGLPAVSLKLYRWVSVACPNALGWSAGANAIPNPRDSNLNVRGFIGL